MRIRRVEAEGIFSFGVGDNRFELDLDRNLTVIVGPNAAGKSNVLLAMRLAQAVLRLQDSADRSHLWATLDEYARTSRHDGMATGRSTVRLDVELSDGADTDLLVSWFRMLVLSSCFRGNPPQPGVLSSLESWVAREITLEKLEYLRSGTLVVSHSGVVGSHWNVAYEFEHEGRPLAWHFESDDANLSRVIAPQGSAGSNRSTDVESRLFGPASRGTQLPPLPTMPFSLELLLPRGDELVRVDMSSLGLNIVPIPYLEFANAAAITVASTDALQAFRRTYSFALVWSRALDRGLRHLDRTSDDRLEEGARPGDGADLYGRLHALKNGDQREQNRYRLIQETFSALAPRQRFEVRTNRSSSGQQSIEIEIFSTESSAIEGRPLRLSGTGIHQTLMVAEILVGDPDRLLLLDEPAVNLHPSWQKLVRYRLGRSEGQCVLITHSPYLVPTGGRASLESIVRLERSLGVTRCHRLSAKEVRDDRWVNALAQELDWSADARGLLFAEGVVLTEGETELAALPAWFSKSQTADDLGGPEDHNLSFHCVGGEQAFKGFVRYLEGFGIPWAIVCDGGVFRFDTGSHIFRQLLDAGVADPDLDRFLQDHVQNNKQEDLNETLFNEMVKFGRARGVFTLAAGWTRRKEREGDRESFEAFVLSQPALLTAFEAAQSEARKSKPKVGRLLAGATDCPAQVDVLYAALLGRLVQATADKPLTASHS